MHNKIRKIAENKNIKLCAQFLGVFLFLIYLKPTDSFFSVYIFLGVAGAYSFVKNTYIKKPQLTNRKKKVYLFTSVVISSCLILANYKLWKFSGLVTLAYSIVKVFLTFYSSIIVEYNILVALDDYTLKQSFTGTENRNHLKRLTIVSFLTFMCIYCSILFLCNYPGTLSPDSISQMSQLLTGQYSNHHPFWHTMIIKLCVSFGMKLFNDINAAVACYSVAQIFFMSACFTFCICTLYQMKAPSLWIFLSLCYFTLVPYHFLYSFTMWKDIPFGLATLLIIVSLFRVFGEIGKRKWLNWVALMIGSFGMCLWRSNGWVAFTVSAIVFMILYGKKYKKISFLFLSAAIVTFVMIHPVLSFLGVNQPDPIESLSIPAQQIARVVVENKEIPEDERELLSKIVEIEKIPEVYKSYISDPVKGLVRTTNNQEFLLSHKMEYLKLWISIGLKNPIAYIKAWIDQTRGYWNGGYSYWTWSEGIFENSLGIYTTSTTRSFPKLKYMYISWFSNSEIFTLLKSIGLYTWTILACGSINLANRKGKQAFLSVPLLAIIATLCIATPVYSEFRYAYALFTCAPMIICAALYKRQA